MKRYAYPPEFIAALLDTAERANGKDARWRYLTTRLATLIRETPSIENAEEMKAIVPQLCWIIQEAGGWFYGPGSSY